MWIASRHCGLSRCSADDTVIRDCSGPNRENLAALQVGWDTIEGVDDKFGFWAPQLPGFRRLKGGNTHLQACFIKDCDGQGRAVDRCINDCGTQDRGVLPTEPKSVRRCHTRSRDRVPHKGEIRTYMSLYGVDLDLGRVNIFFLIRRLYRKLAKH